MFMLCAICASGICLHSWIPYMKHDFEKLQKLQHMDVCYGG